MKKNIGISLSAIALLLMLWLLPSRGDGAGVKTVTINAEFDNGSKRTITLTYPDYASIGVHQSKGGHRLSTWKYCMLKGVARCEETLVYGVVWYEYD